jgi:hypothetical protein
MITSDWIWKRSLSVKDSNFVLAHICMWYLRLEGFNLEGTSGDTEDEQTEDEQIEDKKTEEVEVVSRYDFLDYAALNWPSHFREAMIPSDHTSITLALDICTPQAYPYIIWSQVYRNNFRPASGRTRRRFVRSALWNIPHPDPAWHTLRFREPPNSLHLATRFRHQGVVGQLLTAPGIDVNEANKYGKTLL